MTLPLNKPWAELTELLMVHVHDFGALPPDQPEPKIRLGRLSPST